MVLKSICAIATRVLFISLGLIGIWRVTRVKDDNRFWYLMFLFLPLIGEMIFSLKMKKGNCYRRFSPAILLFLITVVPSIWILELHHQKNRNDKPQCLKLNSWEDVKNMTGSMESHQVLQGAGKVETSLCLDDWILGLHQALLILLILGKWLLPLGGGVTRDELSQLLLIYVGTAADILEFSTETLSDVKENSPELVYIILGVWSLSMLQFPPHLAVVAPDKSKDPAKKSLVYRRSTDMWNIMESLIIQDGPFLVVRLLVLIYYQYFNLMLLFFTAKNFLVVILNVYWLAVLRFDYRNGNSNRNNIV
ncbi:hypothetical protein COCON_G00224510 [Conger conger]|uniref:Transmembrane protein 26 n=1 Tax=Conger conger TaxID=82655 RepID=A0A9Q1CWF9_CONCO|nr:hypothetical protein COCON_G00224510 [Conger conger]